MENFTQELVRFDISMQHVERLRRDYLPLKIQDVNDKENYKLVRSARLEIKALRCKIESTGKTLRKSALDYQRAVMAEEKRIVALLSPVEEHLEAEEKRIDDEKARIKAEAEAREAARIQERVNKLFTLGARFDGVTYSAAGMMVKHVELVACSDEDFAAALDAIADKVQEEKEKLAAEEATRKAEAERLKKIAEEQAQERKRLAEIAAEQKRQQAKIEAEKAALAKKQEEEAPKAKPEEIIQPEPAAPPPCAEPAATRKVFTAADAVGQEIRTVPAMFIKNDVDAALAFADLLNRLPFPTVTSPWAVDLMQTAKNMIKAVSVSLHEEAMRQHNLKKVA